MCLPTNVECTTYADKTGSFLPEDIQNSLLYWRDKFKQGYFEIGDVAAEVIKAFVKEGYVVTNQEVFNEIGRFCGKSGRTIRYYYETATFFPYNVRQRFHNLPFSHFVLARSMDNWEAVLEYAQDHAYQSEEQLRAHFIGVPVCVPAGIEEQGSDTTDRLQPDLSASRVEKQPKVTVVRYAQGVSGLRDGVRLMKEIASVAPLDQEELEYINDMADQIEVAINYLIQVIDKAI